MFGHDNSHPFFETREPHAHDTVLPWPIGWTRRLGIAQGVSITPRRVFAETEGPTGLPGDASGVRRMHGLQGEHHPAARGARSVGRGKLRPAGERIHGQIEGYRRDKFARDSGDHLRGIVR